jgi:DNA-directed RNA polymerase I subunit RPA34.5
MVASKPFAHHLLLSAQSVVPTPCAPSTGDPQASISTGPPYKNPPRQSYPKEVLKHQFMPYGSLVNVTTNDSNEMDIDNVEEEIVIDVDIENPESQPTLPPKARRKQGKIVNETQLETPINPSTTTELQSEGKKAKGKKRKVESMADSSVVKKSKKVKLVKT